MSMFGASQDNGSKQTPLHPILPVSTEESSNEF